VFLHFLEIVYAIDYAGMKGECIRRGFEVGEVRGGPQDEEPM
jgi:hypothetical protein